MLTRSVEALCTLSAAWILAQLTHPEVWDQSYLMWIGLSVFAAGARWGFSLGVSHGLGPHWRWVLGTVLTSVFVGLVSLSLARILGAIWWRLDYFEFRFVMVALCAYFSEQALTGMMRFAEAFAADPGGTVSSALRNYRRFRRGRDRDDE